MRDREPWFEPKTYGFGAGLPIHRNGWIALGAYIGGMLLAGFVFTLALPAAFDLLVPKTYGVGYTMAPGPTALFMGLYLLLAVLPLTLLLTAVAKRHTRGDWRWRWGRTPPDSGSDTNEPRS